MGPRVYPGLQQPPPSPGATHPATNPFGPSAHPGSFLPTGHLTGRCPLRSVQSGWPVLTPKSQGTLGLCKWYLPGFGAPGWGRSWCTQKSLSACCPHRPFQQIKHLWGPGEPGQQRLRRPRQPRTE